MEYWHKQTSDQPLYPDLSWDKPERKDLAGKLLIIGGNLHGFASPAKAFEVAQASGIGYTRILLPESLKRTLHAFWTDAVFCPSTPSGSFARDSKEIVLQNALWADGLLLPGDLGRNSETAVMLDGIIASIKSILVITKDALDYYMERPSTLLARGNTIIVPSFSQLQKMLTHSKFATPLTFTMPLSKLVEALHELTLGKSLGIITKFEETYVVAYGGQVSTTPSIDDKDIWRLDTASEVAVSVVQNPSKIFEAMTHSITL